MDLDGDVAFVTGTSRGIGKALALRLADAGAAVVSTGKTVEEHERLPGTIVKTTEEIRERGGESIAVELDVRDEANVRSAIDRTIEEYGRLDIVINNAGAIHFGTIADTPAKRFDLLMDVNVRGTYVTTRAALPYLRSPEAVSDGAFDGRPSPSDDAPGGGHVVTMSPPLGMEAAPGKAPYALSKLGMTFVAKSLAAELSGEAINVNALWPVTAVDSEATRHFGMGEPADWRTPAVVCDAVAELLSRDPGSFSGHAVYDEDVLRAAGVDDFSEYAVVDGTAPGPLSAQLFDSGYDRDD
jgi:citronellol/citronellal dehydrogenase